MRNQTTFSHSPFRPEKLVDHPEQLEGEAEEDVRPKFAERRFKIDLFINRLINDLTARVFVN